jgi:undecaprenyl-diphosphatase
MSNWQALLLGVVEGLTEYLPVSSTGHLILTQKLLGVADGEGVKAFEIVIQAGAILAVVGVYARRIADMVLGIFGRSQTGRELALRLFVAFAITSAIGLTFNKPIKERFFNLNVVSGAWIAGGIAIVILEMWRWRHFNRRSLAELTWGGAIIIGLMQSIALCPGVSRSLVTLAGGLFVGLSFTAALEFSFLLGGITLVAASGYEASKHWKEIFTEIDTVPALIALAAATLSAWICVRWMLRSLERFGLLPFAIYRVVLGVVVIVCIARGIVTA